VGCTQDIGHMSGGGGLRGEARGHVRPTGATAGGRVGVVDRLVTPGSIGPWLDGPGDRLICSSIYIYE
jgi:hypothetical protein